MNVPKKARSSIRLRVAIKRQRHIPRRKYTRQALRRITSAMLVQAAADAELLGRSIKVFDGSDDDMLKRKHQEKYWWVRATLSRYPKFPHDEAQKLCQWWWGDQFDLITEFLDIDEYAVRRKYEELMQIGGQEES